MGAHRPISGKIFLKNQVLGRLNTLCDQDKLHILGHLWHAAELIKQMRSLFLSRSKKISILYGEPPLVGARYGVWGLTIQNF